MSEDLCSQIQSLHILHNRDPNALATTAKHQSTEIDEGKRSSKVPQHVVSDDDFERLGVLGRGASSTVFKVKHCASNILFALKCIPRRLIQSKLFEAQVRKEINVHRLLKHPNIVRLHTYYITATELCIVMQLCQATLEDKLKAYGGTFDEKRAARYTRQIVRALSHLHDNSLFHRDLKLENILFDEQGAVRVADFGWVAELPSSTTQATECTEEEAPEGRKTFCGTLDYLPPETFSGEGRLQSADVWSLGVVVAEMLTGEPPFFAESYSDTLHAICNVEPKLPSTLSDSCRELLCWMLQKDPRKRPSTKEILAHPWTSLDKM